MGRSKSARPGLAMCTTLSGALLLGCGTSGSSASPNGGGGTGGGAIVILDAGDSPAQPPDGASACPSGDCNYQTGAGCTGAQLACVPLLSGSAVVPACGAAGTGTQGSACTASADCKPNYFCAAGACKKLCCGGDWTACESAKEHCIEALAFGQSDGGALPANAMLCAPINTCDVLKPKAQCSQAGFTCQIADQSGVTACMAEGSGGVGGPCPCQGGFACVSDSAGPACRRLCAAVAGGGVPGCLAGEGACVHFHRDPIGVGECTLLSSAP